MKALIELASIAVPFFSITENAEAPLGNSTATVSASHPTARPTPVQAYNDNEDRLPDNLPDLLRFCHSTTPANSTQAEFVEVIPEALQRCVTSVTRTQLIEELQQDFCPELLVHPDIIKRSTLRRALITKLAELNVAIPPFTAGHRKSNAI
ncbi:hypothetical protein BWQ96_03292 [Gracilariopsis chorda]|uniref:Uncharacterized protein n=1 Tax=Gracilariopsis chorda TaxID=448386 RepID=A0A2V3IXS6_9FLOR|nr:hypothetical protein BWQ96_03292 [Gracilariopsis chorda]|eukprot:PXF46954.1 hypothetical protein BWQ96_03292 [Gracilariopsis chorda]